MTLFDFNRTKAWAHVSFPVKAGEMVKVSVMENRPRLKLKIVDQTRVAFSHANKSIPISTFPTENTIQKLQSEIGKIIGLESWKVQSKTLPMKISTGIEQLFSHFEQLDMGKKVSDLSFRLRSYIENSGIFFEKRIENKIQNLYHSHTEISTRDLQQNQSIKNIIKSDLKPCLLILKHFIHENERKPQKGSTNNLLHLKPLINRMLENIGFQQSKSHEIEQGQKVSAETVYLDPRKGAHINIREMEKVAPKLRQFLKTEGHNLDKNVHSSILKVADTFESTFLRKNAANPITRDLQQNQSIKNIIKSDLKPCLLILKHFIHENERKPQKGSTNNLLHLKPLINRMLENIGFQQSKSHEIEQGQKVSAETVYLDPRKGAHINIREMEKVAPKLRQFLKTEGHNLDKNVHSSILKVADTFESTFLRKNAANPIIDETTIRNIFKEDMPQHLKKLEEFFNHRAASVNPLESKELEDIKKLLSRVRAEIENQQVTGDVPKKAQKSETGQVITFTLPLPQEDGKGKLKVFYSKKRKSSTDDGFKMSLLLQMQNTGAVRTDFFLLDKQLKIDFYLNDHKIKEMIQAHADSIETSLAKHFNRVLVKVVISERKVEEFDIEHLLTEHNSLIDLRV